MARRRRSSESEDDRRKARRRESTTRDREGRDERARRRSKERRRRSEERREKDRRRKSQIQLAPPPNQNQKQLVVVNKVPPLLPRARVSSYCVGKGIEQVEHKTNEEMTPLTPHKTEEMHGLYDKDKYREHRHRRTRSRSERGERERERERERKEKEKTYEDDKDGHLMYKKGQVLRPTDGNTSFYRIERDLGEGTFGKVVEVSMGGNGKTFALKIIRNISKYREAARYEIRVLRTLRDADPKGENLIVPLIEHFDYHGHSCLLFPLLGQSVFDFLKDNDYAPFSLEHVQQIGYQLTKSVLFMHRNRLTHTDLKPENLMFRHRGYETILNEKGKKYRRMKDASVVLIDLGGATFEDEHHTTIVSTRHYRAPEVILELGWTHPCDVWSIGCILFEMYTGYTLFQTHDSREHLAIMERSLGKMPLTMAERSKTRHYRDGRLAWDENSHDGRYVKDKCHPLKSHMRHSSKECDELFNLIKLMLEYDPDRRITLDVALDHPFYDKVPDTIRHQYIDGAVLPA